MCFAACYDTVERSDLDCRSRAPEITITRVRLGAFIFQHLNNGGSLLLIYQPITTSSAGN